VPGRIFRQDSRNGDIPPTGRKPKGTIRTALVIHRYHIYIFYERNKYLFTIISTWLSGCDAPVTACSYRNLLLNGQNDHMLMVVYHLPAFPQLK
jgi:hypothetical protein